MAPEDSSARFSFLINENPIKKGIKAEQIPPQDRVTLVPSQQSQQNKMIFRYFTETFHSSLEILQISIKTRMLDMDHCLGMQQPRKKGYFVCAGRHLDCLALLYTLLEAGEFINTIILWKNLHIVT